MGDDGAGATRPTRTWWCARSSAIISRGSIARSCWSMRSRRSTPDRKRCTISKPRWREFSIVSGSAAARLLSSLFRPRIDRILFAATKADHLHHSSHDRLEAVLRRTVARAAWPRRGHRRRDRRGGAGRGARHPRGDGRARPRQTALDPRNACSRRDRGRAKPSTAEPRSRPFRATCRPIRKSFSRAKPRFAASPAHRPKRPIFAFCAFGRRNWSAPVPESPTLPHIRLDRALQFLIGDRLQ